MAGATDDEISALREASKAATAELVVTTSPDAEVSLDGAPQGRADTHGELTVKAGLGNHTLKVSLAGKKDFVQTVALPTRQETKIEARLEDIPRPQEQVRPAAKPGRPNARALTKEDIISLLQGGVSSVRIVPLVTERGVSFSPTTNSLNEIRTAGGNEDLVQAIQQAAR